MREDEAVRTPRTRRSVLVPTVLCLLTTFVAAGAGGAVPTHHFDATAFAEELDDALDGNVVGYASAVVDADGFRALVSNGYAQRPGDGDVEMRTWIYSAIGSVSKMLSGVALLNLFDEHVLSNLSVQEQLDQPFWGQLPQKWQDAYAGSNLSNVTYRQLLQHKSGFRLTSDGEAGLPASASGHQMQYMIAQDVDPVDIGDRKYNNFNYTLLLFLIPAIAYPDDVAVIHDAFDDLDIEAYSMAINVFYGILYERYMQEEIFPNTVTPITPTCRPAEDLADDEYAFGYSSVSDANGSLLSTPNYCRSQGTWYITARELATFARTYAFTNTFIGPTTRASLYDPNAPDDRLLYNFAVSNDGFAIDQSEFAYHGGTQGNYRAALVALPYGSFGVLLTNTPEPDGFTSGELAQIVLDAFEAAVEDTPPVIYVSVIGPLGNNGWRVGDVSVDWTVYDLESAVSSTSGCDDTTVTTDTGPSGVTFTCTATSLGGTSSESVTVRRDATAPTAVVIGVEDGDSIAAVDPPVISCSATDPNPGSGIVDPTPTPAIADQGGGFYTAACTARDDAGNSHTASATYKLVSPELIADEVAATSLNGGQQNSLLTKLGQIQSQLEKGKTKQAVNVMKAFESEVLDLIAESELLPAQGQVLLDDIRVLIEFYS